VDDFKLARGQNFAHTNRLKKREREKKAEKKGARWDTQGNMRETTTAGAETDLADVVIVLHDDKAFGRVERERVKTVADQIDVGEGVGQVHGLGPEVEQNVRLRKKGKRKIGKSERREMQRAGPSPWGRECPLLRRFSKRPC
jgi:hypothetical protein